ncbi:ABC transporter ATP-binding protein [Plantactinospora sonchi]|uniref:ABC transporter ATP-binding protein n=1 Tax=Plantactinospora sonchi TaxID=1544735 RepID=A0ABU7RYB6_9ACTN
MSPPVATPDDAAAAPGTRTGGLPAAVRRIMLAGSLVVRGAPWTALPYAVLTLAAGALPVVIAWLTKLVVDGLVAGVALGTLLTHAAGLALAGLLVAVTAHVTQYLSTEVDRAVGLAAQERLFTAVDRFIGLVRFENPHFLDRLRLAQQPGGMSPYPCRAVDGVLGIGRTGFTIIGFLGSLFLLSPVMTGLVVLAGLPTLAAQLALSRRRARMIWEIGPAERREFFYSGLLSTVEAAKEVRLFGIGAFLRDRMLANRRVADVAKRAMDRQQVRVQAGLGLLAATVSGGGLLWAVSSAHQGRLAVGDIMMFAAAVAGVQGALTTLAGDIARTHQALSMFDHYVAVTAAGPDLPLAAAPRKVPPLRTGIEVRDVWFRYSTRHEWALRGVDLHIPHGQALALVGRNGAGKSTLVKLLCRLYDPTRGAILWDGVDIREFDVAELRVRIGAVFQDYMEYDMTAAENIALGDLESLDDRRRIRAAAEQAGIDDTLSGLPHGYDTLLSRLFFSEDDRQNPETGVVLSGGQWQRLALARAFLRDRRDLMILDEPSSGMDAEAEHRIHASLTAHRGGQTSLLISHRLGAVRDADQIVVLAGGRVVEQGDHRTLVAAGGDYAHLFALQAAGYQPETDRSPALTEGVR